MIKSIASCVVRASPSEVFAVITDPAQMLKLGTNPIAVLFEEELPNGCRKTHVRSYLANGATFDAHNEILERVRDERVVSRSTVVPFGFAPTRSWRFGRAEVDRTLTIEPHTEGALLRTETSYRFEPALLRLYFRFFQRDQWQRASEDSLQRLRKFLL
jgi:polyketide cyclase/dehydrase/lipid transport protein